MVAADLTHTETLIRAFEGANAIFAVTDFFSSFMDPVSELKLKPGQTINEYSFEYEKRQGMNIMDAVSTVKTLERFVWSGLSAAKRWSKGKYTQVYHFDSKAEVTEYLKTTYPKTWAKTSVIMVGFYLENALRVPLVIPQKVGLHSRRSKLEPLTVLQKSDGVYEVVANHAPSVLWPYIETQHDTGIFVRALILDVPAGKNLYAYRKLMSIEDFLQLWGKINGVPVRYREIGFDEMVEVGGILGREGAESFAYNADFGYEGRDDPTVVHPKDVSLHSQHIP